MPETGTKALVLYSSFIKNAILWTKILKIVKIMKIREETHKITHVKNTNYSLKNHGGFCTMQTRI